MGARIGSSRRSRRSASCARRRTRRSSSTRKAITSATTSRTSTARRWPIGWSSGWGEDPPARERSGPHDRRRAEDGAPQRATRRPRPHRHAFRLRHGPVRRVLRARRWARGGVVPASGRAGRRREHHHDRRPGARRRAFGGAEGLRREGRDAMRVLHQWHAHLGDGAPRDGSAADGGRDPRCAQQQPLPLRRLCAGDRRGEARSGGDAMSGWGEDEPERVEERIRIERDGTVVALSGKIEFGQGIRTAFAQIVADELEVPIEQVRVVLGDTAQVPWDMGTFGSRSVAEEGPALRRAAAYARRLREEGKPIEGVVPDDVELREDGGRYVGKPLPRLKGHDIVTGRATYVADLRHPDIVDAALVRPPTR